MDHDVTDQLIFQIYILLNFRIFIENE